MPLRIRNEETCRLAAELVDLTGETKTGAITIAVRERLERIREAEARATQLRDIGKRT